MPKQPIASSLSDGDPAAQQRIWALPRSVCVGDFNTGGGILEAIGDVVTLYPAIGGVAAGRL